MLTSPPPPEHAGRRRPRYWLWLVPLACLLGAALMGAAVFPVPYYALEPGSARAVEPLVRVKGSSSYPSKGSVLFTTVSLKQVTALGALRGWIDKDTDVLPRKDILGDRSARQNRQLNVQMMDTSKETATQVALEKLGYKVPVTGTGAIVASVSEDLPAAKELRLGDVVVEADGQKVSLAGDLVRIVQARKPGDTVQLTVERGHGGPITMDVPLGAKPDAPDRAMLGVEVQTRELKYHFPVHVDIDSGAVGGPSAGLAFTLGVLDLMTPGELTGGEAVAVTGTMAPDGTVGPVGGVIQKTAAVKRAGVKVFLVPSDEYKDAKAHAGRGLRVIKVDTLDEALKALASLGGNALALGSPGSGRT